jgi:molybdopterin-dependent oxidoreductase alpha subunit
MPKPRTNAQPPESFTGFKRKPKVNVAGGIGSVIAALRHLRHEMGPVRGLSTLMKMNQQGGFDCPGCAWPDPDDRRSVLGEYCENGAKAFAEEATLKRVDPEFFAKYAVSEMAQGTDFWIGKQGRITHPMILRAGQTHYEPIAWEDAFQLIASHLNELDSPDEAIFYTSGRTSNEAAFLYQLFVRMFGTNNLPDCSNMCHESSGRGLGETVGIGKGSVTLEDLYEAEVIMVMGQNPGTNHPRMLTALQTCKQNGGKIITVNPLPETGLMRFKHPQKITDMMGMGTQLTDVFLPVRINGDVALLKALMRLMWEAEQANPGTVFDQQFIQEYTSDYKSFVDDLFKYDFSYLVAQAGVATERIQAAADLLIQHDKIIICWAMGLTQHTNGVDNIREIVNLLLLKGSIGKPGAGTCPVRGHSNVQGDRTVGIWERPTKAFLDRLKNRLDFEPPRQHGYDTVEAIKAMHNGKVRVFFAMGGNFLSATPDTEYTAEALRKCDLTVQVSTKLNRSHLVHGKTALILPCLGRTEEDRQASGLQFVTVENSMGKVHSSQGTLRPASPHLLGEPMIVAQLAYATLGPNTTVDWAYLVNDYDRIRDLIEDCIPGFEDYNRRVRNAGGFYLPNGARERKFHTPDGKAHFSVVPVPEFNLPEGAYLMMTVRSHDQYNTTIYGLDDRYRGIYNERRVILMNREDMKAAGLAPEQVVHLHSHYEGETRTVRNFLAIPFDIPRRCTATYFPEANVLVPINHKAKISNTPASKHVVITVSSS